MHTREELLTTYNDVRRQTENLCEPLAIEDYVIQGMGDASPPKWNLAHVTWFLETFILGEFVRNYRPHNESYAFLFNSYYVQAGPRHRRDHRGMVGRPTVDEVMLFRKVIDERIAQLVTTTDDDTYAKIHDLIVLGMNHEQQHQELLLTDVKYNLFMNPLYPAYRKDLRETPRLSSPPKEQWLEFEGGVFEMGHPGGGFAYDNEGPRHKIYLNPFKLRQRLVTNGEYLKFIEDGGYETAPLWLSDGLDVVRQRGWEAPLYWVKLDGRWKQFTLGGLREINPDEPVTHISHYEADAFATWAGKRLATEFEWEIAAETASLQAGRGHFVEDGWFHPAPVEPGDNGKPHQMYGDVWEWTRSAYLPYPGFQPAEGAIGEYNGKFMANQMVLRGGSCATPRNHIRATYRNFFHADKRWQFTGIRLADDHS